MNPLYAVGTDGMNGFFFQKCWNIINQDLMKQIKEFFQWPVDSYTIFSFIYCTSTQGVQPRQMNDLRPIVLSNIISQIISKKLSTRLSPILPNMISLNKSGFVKGRSFSENIMLAQEIIHHIRNHYIGSNVIVKLHIKKAYDILSSAYICLVLRKMRFNKIFIDMMCRVMANNLYSIITNGKRFSFFQYSSVLK